ncbi:MAG: hypothetical protein HYT27_03545, partial [Parcubacteria group bacterium]|nr:hypothetical protein [Parcubacteria group bacterium]
ELGNENKPKLESKEAIPEFHFKEIAEIEPALVSLVKQLQEKIESGKYDTLISDDVGGRIPTLILRKIIKEHNPDKKLGTFFIASGKTYLPTSTDTEKYEQLQEHLKKVTDKTRKALIITQFIFTGKTLIRLANALKEAGVNNFDIPSVDAMPHFEQESVLRNVLGDNNLYVGSEAWHHLHEEHEKLGGIRKTKKYSPFPRRMDEVIAKEGRELSFKEWREIFGIEKSDSSKVIIEKSRDPEKDAEFERRTHAPLTPEEKEEIQKNINFAREDVKLLSDKVVAQVWAERKEK